MFEDIQITNPNQPPTNLPIGEPEDIYSGVADEGEAGASMAPVAPPPAPLTSAVSAGVLTPKAYSTPMAVPPPPPNRTMPEAPTEMYPAKGPVLSRGLMVIIIVAVVAGILGGGGWWVYSSFIKPATPGQFDNLPAVDNNEPAKGLDQQVSEPVSTVPAENNTNTNQNLIEQNSDNSVLFGEVVDTDGDQLDDELEKTANTDPDNWDTDGDGLSDGDEVLIWKTDPLNPDTDGDTYLDGAEVKNGYNPKGEGKLLTIPTSTAK